MKRTFLAKLQRNGLYCTIGALLLLVGIPLYQFLILIPSGYSNALATQSLALHWINTHSLLFLGYRALLFAGFAFIISMPFTLFRIIVAQEILGREADEQEEDDKEQVVQDEAKDQSDNHLEDGMPAFAYLRVASAVVFSVSAAEVAFTLVTGQSLITALAILLFSVWVLWFGIMLVRLKPE